VVDNAGDVPSIIIRGARGPFDLARGQIERENRIEIILRLGAVRIGIVGKEAGLNVTGNRKFVAGPYIDRVPNGVDDGR
jgi:hypothetical protein